MRRKILSSDGRNSENGASCGTSWNPFYHATRSPSTDFLSERTGHNSWACCEEVAAASRGVMRERLLARHGCRAVAFIFAGVAIGARVPDLATIALVLLAALAAAYFVDTAWDTRRLHLRMPATHAQRSATRFRVHPLAALHELLLSMFHASGLRRFIRLGEDGDTICAELPGERASMTELVDGVLAQLQQRGLVDLTLLRLHEKFPRRRADIHAVADVWAGRPGRASMLPAVDGPRTTRSRPWSNAA